MSYYRNDFGGWIVGGVALGIGLLIFKILFLFAAIAFFAVWRSVENSNSVWRGLVRGTLVALTVCVLIVGLLFLLD